MLQYLKPSLLIFILISLSCVTKDELKEIPISNYFLSDNKEEWVNGLELLSKKIDSYNFDFLLQLYLDPKYKGIRKDITPLLQEYQDKDIIDYSKIIEILETDEENTLFSQFIGLLSDSEIIAYANELLISESTNRKKLLANLGLYALKSNQILELYNTDDEYVKSGIIYSSGFMKSADINNWLVQRLYEENEALATEALFSLATHGSSGFSLLARNLSEMPDRLVLSSINILTFNKVDEAFTYFPPLFLKGNTLISDKIISSYQGLGEKAYPYIIKSLELSGENYRLTLLKLLEIIKDKDYIGDILFLLKYPSLQDYIINLIFKNSKHLIIQDILSDNKFNIREKIYLFGLKNSSPLLFKTTYLNNLSLDYFLNNFTKDEVNGYFKLIGFDDNYLEDYNFLIDIYSDIKIIKSFDDKKETTPFVSRYFELLNNVEKTEKNESDFFDGMESWLENRDPASLGEIKSIKELDSLKELSADEEITIFFNSLSREEKELIDNYNISKNRIKRNYRALTFRFRNYGTKLLIDYGYLYLVK